MAEIGPLLLLVTLCGANFISCSSHGYETDRLSLLEVKEAITLDPQLILRSWNDSTNLCDWEGISCTSKDSRRVTSVDLKGRGLAGPISPSLGNLTMLKHLFLQNNGFSGEIPVSLGQLKHLRSLVLTNNTLQGSIPDFSNCSRMDTLLLNKNQLTGRIPGKVNLPPLLTDLYLSVNNISGTLPTSLANITTLKNLVLTENHIEGSIPSEFGGFPVLEILALGANRISGTFQFALLNISSLVSLSLAGNFLHGEVPSNLCSSLQNLQYLTLFQNTFEGAIPSSLANASDLNMIDLSSNNFTGVVLSSIGKLRKLSILNLERNQLEAYDEQGWEFMESLSNCTELYVLSLYDNQLGGHIPNSLGNLSAQLQYLYFGQNRISGSFPSSVANLRNLVSLGLSHNNFEGPVLEAVASLRNLQGLTVHYNHFTGLIPSSLANLSHLEQLSLATNMFHGPIPQSLGNLDALVELNISANYLNGTIPNDLFNIPTLSYCYMSFNNLDGPLPHDIGNAKQLTNLQLSSNKLSGDIPITLSSCESLESMELDHNFLNGTIPEQLENLSSLKVLDISHNNLSGSIPNSLGNLKYIDKLDLSFNYLNGEVPTEGIFKNASAVFINENQGLCGGAQELKLPKCSLAPSASTRHRGFPVLKIVMPIASVLVLLAVIYVLFCSRKMSKKETKSLPSFNTKIPQVSYRDISKATLGFSASNLIGAGRYGYVYKGELFQDGNLVAVKVFKVNIEGAIKSFIAECNALRNVRHRNLVRILTVCSSIDSKGDDFKAIVYEFMPRGDLHDLLYSAQSGETTALTFCQLTLDQRLSIAVDVADALSYLHHNNIEAIVHCDLKPSNILLDENMIARVGDFGLARFKVDNPETSLGFGHSSTSTALQGTVGYTAPECAAGGKVSTASDVYSFGIVLLELFIRKKPTDDMFRDGLTIVKYAEMNFPDKILHIVDNQILLQEHVHEGVSVANTKEVHECLISVLDVGLSCTNQSPHDRTSMQEVAAKLHGIRDTHHGGIQKIKFLVSSK
ncbi:unnamed protein product [Urochloa decumbens]